jgi:hypothetical protein
MHTDGVGRAVTAGSVAVELRRLGLYQHTSWKGQPRLAEPLIAVAHLETDRLEGKRDAVRRNTLFREVYRRIPYPLFDRNTPLGDRPGSRRRLA